MAEQPLPFQPSDSPKAGAEHRKHPRYVPNPETSSHLVTKVADTLPAKMLDISVGGLCLLVNRHFTEGTTVEVEVLNKSLNFQISIDLCVRYVQQVSEAVFFLGGDFVKPLSTADLRKLLS